MPENDGGQAFPVPGDEERTYTPGMSLRDWFAGQALAGIVQGTQSEKMKPTCPGEAAHWAYMIAEAMLAAREANHA